jgi:hypothetical protein
MNIEQFARDSGRMVREYEYDDGGVTVAADLGAGADANVDVVDGTAIVVFDDDRQVELDLPTGDAKALIRNGVLIIEVDQE